MKNDGLTMIELLIVVTIASILLAVGVPGMQDIINGVTVNNQAKTLRSALNYTRSEAVRRNMPVTLCASSDTTSCSDNAWNEGWLVFVDGDEDGTVDAAEEIVRVYQGPSGGTQISYSLSDDLISYDAMGFSMNSNSTRRFELCPADNDVDNAQAVELSATGRVRLTTENISCS